MNNLSIGQKIRKYRQRVQISQMDLELAIDASFGSVSRIESGRVNPTKETIIKISEVLNLKPYEHAELVSVDTAYFINILKTATDFWKFHDIDALLQNAADVISKELELLGIMIDLLENNQLCNKAFTCTWYSEGINKILGAPYNSFKYDFNSLDQITGLTLREKKSFTFKHLKEICCPPFPVQVANMLNAFTGFKSGITFPLISSEGKTLGIIYYGKNYPDDFSADMDILKAFAEAVSIAVENAIKYEELKKKVI